jgi:hypothetical protein
MAKQKGTSQITDLVTIQPTDKITVLPPNSGIVGAFLEQTANMFKAARAMRMQGLLRRVDEAGQRTEVLLKMAAERKEAAEEALKGQFSKEGLLTDTDSDENGEIV